VELNRAITIGILDLQGCVNPHIKHFEKLNCKVVKVKNASQLKEIDGLVIPGGESSAMIKNISNLNLWPVLKNFCQDNYCWGICAGTIILATNVEPSQESLKAINIHVKRNAYGRQLQSSIETINGYEVMYIRAPVISKSNKDITILAKDINHNPSWVTNKKAMACTFHAELNHLTPSPMHKYFVEKIINNAVN